MYDNDFKVSAKYARSTKSVVEAAINNFEESQKVETPKYKTAFSEEASDVITSTMRRESVLSRYHSFSETVRSSLVVESLYKLFKESVSDDIKDDRANLSVMRAITSQYVHENGYDDILNRMKTGSVYLSELYNTITNSAKMITESVDKDDPNTFTIKPEMKDEFFKSLDYSDSSEITKEIQDRVKDAMTDFVTANTKDHEDIQDALDKAQEKIKEVPEEDTELRESYEFQAKRKISSIRNAPKSVFHTMVTSMCENVLKHQDTLCEFMYEGHLDIDKIVTRTSLMYTFMEMLNTARIDKVDNVFIESMINDLKNN